jgi:hypothetical protein
LRQHILHQGGVGESVHDPGIKISPKAISPGEVEHELGWDKGAVLNTSTPSAACDIQGILFCSRLNIIAVTAKSGVSIKNGSLEDFRGAVVFWLRVLRPVPIPVVRSI